MTKCATQKLMQDVNIVLKGVCGSYGLLCSMWESCLESVLEELGIYRYKYLWL